MSSSPTAAGDGNGSERPPLTLAHTEETIQNHAGYDYWKRRSTDDILDSLLPGAGEPLRVRPDGTVVQGNTRVFILRQRGYEVDSLPRTIEPWQRLDDYHDRD